MDDQPATPEAVEALRDALARATEGDLTRLLGEDPDALAKRDPIQAIRLSLYALTAEQWFGLLTGDEGGVLPPCCAEISDLRDQLVELARMPTMHGAAAAVRSICALESHGLGAHLAALSDALADVLDVARPGWLETDLGVPDPDRELVMRAHLELTGHYGSDSTYEPRPRVNWALAMLDAVESLSAIVMPYGDLVEPASAWERRYEVTLAKATKVMRAGGPLRPLLTIVALAQELRPSDG